MKARSNGMKKIDILHMALRNFGRRKARSFLTVLGVVVGTMSVVVMISIGQGLNESYKEEIESWGSLTQIQVSGTSTGPDTGTGVGGTQGDQLYLDDNSVASLSQIPNVLGVMPVKNESVSLIKGKEIWTGNVMGIDLSKMALFGFKTTKGRLLEPTDKDSYVMGYMTAFSFYDPKGNGEWINPTDDQGNPVPLPFDPTTTKLKMTFDTSYGYEMSVGKPKMSKVNCVGVLKMASDDFSYSIIMDYNTVERLKKDYEKKQTSTDTNGSTTGNTSSKLEKNKNKYDIFYVKVDDVNNVSTVQSAITDMGFSCWSAMDILNQVKEQMKIIQFVLGGIGAIAFFVAAIGISNTMVMSIYERTREIGIMKVLGCHLKDIMSLFLMEAALIGLLGGLVGLGLSEGLSFLLNYLSSSGALGGMSIGSKLSVIPFWLIICGIVFPTFMGLVSGLYPAWRATRLSALDAIKNE